MGVVAVAPVVPLAGGGGGGSGAPPRQGRGRWYCRATPPRGPPATAVDAAGGPLRRHDRRRRCRWPQWARTERERRDKRRRRRHAQRGHPTGGGHGASCRHRDGDEGCRGRKTNTPGCGGRWWPRRRSGQDAGAAATAAVPATRSRVGGGGKRQPTGRRRGQRRRRREGRRRGSGAGGTAAHKKTKGGGGAATTAAQADRWARWTGAKRQRPTRRHPTTGGGRGRGWGGGVTRGWRGATGGGWGSTAWARPHDGRARQRRRGRRRWRRVSGAARRVPLGVGREGELSPRERGHRPSAGGWWTGGEFRCLDHTQRSIIHCFALGLSQLASGGKWGDFGVSCRSQRIARQWAARGALCRSGQRPPRSREPPRPSGA